MGIVVFLYGIVIGSFLNVCIYRIPKGEKIGLERSHCTSCGHHLGVLDLVPILSYIASRGRCRYCKEKYSSRYALVELLTGVIFVAIYANMGISVVSVLMMILASILVVITFTDIDHMIIPNKVVLFGIISGLIANGLYIYTGLYPYINKVWYSGLIGGLAPCLLLFILSWISTKIYGEEGGIGMGDVKLFIPIGLFLGWGYGLLSLWLSFIIGAVVGVVLLVTKKKGRKDHIPFGPSIAVATLLTILYGQSILLLLFK